MMERLQALYQRYFTLHYNAPNLIERQRAYGLLMINWVVLLIWALYMVFVITARTLSGVQPLNIVTFLVGFGVPVIFVLIYNLIQSGRGSTATALFVALLVVSIAPYVVSTQSDEGIILALLPIIAAGLMLNRRGFLLVTGIITLAFVGHVIIVSGLTSPIRLVPARELALTVPLIAISVALSTLFFMVFSGSSERISIAISNEVQHLRAVGSFATAASDEDENRVIVRALRLLEEGLGYRLAQYYPVDAEGRPLRRLRLNANRDELLGTPNLTGVGLLAGAARGEHTLLRRSDSDEAARYLAASSPGNEARTALFVPVLLEGRVVGVLDVQSAGADTFSAGLASALDLLAQALARGIAISRDFTELNLRIAEQRQIIARASQGTTTLTRGIGRTDGTAFSGTFTDAVAYQMGAAGGLPGLQQVAAADLPDAVRQALARGEVHIESITTENGIEQAVKIPIALRGQLFGAMSFYVPVEHTLSERQLEIARTVANRLATTLENTRLFEQTQTQAARERKANVIGSELLTTTDIDVLMDIAARTFNDALGAVQTQIYLDPRRMDDPAFAADGDALLTDSIIVGGVPRTAPNGAANGHTENGYEPGGAHA